MSKKLTIEDFQVIAKEHGGKCLSDQYLNYNIKLRWECAKGHIWEASVDSIRQGHWCRKCGTEKSACKRRKSLEDMVLLAKRKYGKCLSEKYIDNKTKLIWQCERGHIWEAAPGHIQSGRWCPHCKPIMLADRFRGDFQEYKDIAKSKGGLCLSTCYVNAHTKLKWQCKEGHIWEAIPDAIKRGQWCPKCTENISERICRKIFENIFNERFPKKRPDWLKLPNGRNMELDGYCSKLGFAFEYQGEQHYKDVLRYDGKRSLDQQKELDEFKRRKCEEHTVILIEVPFFVDYEKMPNFIIDECKKKSIMVPEITKTLDYKLLNIYSPEKIKEMQEIAREKGGKCLSDKYINSVTKLKWQCEKGHIWEATPAAIKSGYWCHYCAGNLKWTLKQIIDLAQERKGACLSEVYHRNYDKLKWRCEYGHVWEATVTSVRAGSWCPICGGTKKKTLLEMQNLAQLRQGKCLSIQYINAHKKMTWQCKEGHTWQATPDDIQQGKWCPYCAHHIKLTIEQMQDLAKLKGGICLSTQYLGVDTKLRWKCKEGHIWEATPYHIKNRGTWCPKCSRKEAGMNRRLTIEEMQEIGIKKGGECLSKEYVNERALLQWRCKMNHIWQANAHDIKRGRWCPICKKAARGASIKYNRNYRSFPHQYTF